MKYSLRKFSIHLPSLFAFGLLMMFRGPVLATTLTLEVESPAFSNEFVEFRLAFHNQPGSTTLQQVQTNWVHQLAESLYQLPQNATYPDSFAMMLEWQVAIDPEGDTAEGWYLERGEDAMHVQRGLFGADLWQAGEDLVLVIGLPLSQGAADSPLLAAGVRAVHHVASAEASPYTFATKPTPDPDPARQGAPPEAIRMGASSEAFLLRWQTIAGHSYLLQQSDDLIGWEAVGPAATGDDSPLQQIIPLIDEPAAFYRLNISTP